MNKPEIAINPTVLIDDDDIDSDPDEIKPPLYLQENQDGESSPNEHHEEEVNVQMFFVRNFFANKIC